MGRLFGRAFQVMAYRAEIEDYFGEPQPNATIIRDLRVQFSVEKSNGSDPNKADVIITNLAKGTRAAIVRKPIKIQISAGYDGQARHIFTGDLRHGYSAMSGPDWETRLQLADGDRAFRYARINRSYKPGTSVLTALRDAAGGMGLSLPSNVEASTELREQFSAGISLYGAARDELSRLLAPYGYRWSVQNGQLQILRDDETREDRAWPITADKDMHGSPEWTTPTKAGEAPKLKVRCALYPELTPGGTTEIVSSAVNGIFRIEKVTHTGDTHGDEWATEIQAKAV